MWAESRSSRISSRSCGAALLLLIACGGGDFRAPQTGRRIVDLSHAFDEESIYWPTEEGFVLERGPAGLTPGGYYYEAHRFRGAEHGGTHIDAPIHFHADRWHVDEIPLERLVGPGVRVEVRAAVAEDRDYRVDVADLQAWERRHGRIPDGALVLLHTGYGRFWPERGAYLGTSARGAAAVEELHFPGLHPEAARWLVAERQVRAVGLDTASIDHGPSRNFEAHQVLCAANVPVFENVGQLDRLPPRGFEVVALPMKIRGGSGAPLRIIAILPGR